MTKFKLLQDKLGISVKGLSEILHVSVQLIYYWRIYGVRNWATAKRLADKLNCKPEDIIG